MNKFNILAAPAGALLHCIASRQHAHNCPSYPRKAPK